MKTGLGFSLPTPHIRVPSLSKRVAGKLSLKGNLRNRLGLKLPAGTQIVTNPKRYFYNKAYRHFTVGLNTLVSGHSRKGRQVKPHVRRVGIIGVHGKGAPGDVFENMKKKKLQQP